jgi:hypothetical protein
MDWNGARFEEFDEQWQVIDRAQWELMPGGTVRIG